MKRFIGPLALLVLLAAPALTHAQNKYPDDETGRGGGAPLDAWIGGPNSLPIGNGSRDEAITHALGMSAMRPLIDEFLRRGYERTPAEDEAILQPNLSVVAITFQKPGWSTSYRQPVILVASKKIGDYFVSQIYGGIVGGDDPDGPMQAYDLSPDEALFVQGRVLGGGGRGVLRTEMKMPGDGEVYAGYDPAGFIPTPPPVSWSYQVEISSGVSADVWKQYGVVVGTATLMGGLNGYRTGTWQGAAWGAVSAWYVANTAFWATH